MQYSSDVLWFARATGSSSQQLHRPRQVEIRTDALGGVREGGWEPRTLQLDYFGSAAAFNCTIDGMYDLIIEVMAAAAAGIIQLIICAAVRRGKLIISSPLHLLQSSTHCIYRSN